MKRVKLEVICRLPDNLSASVHESTSCLATCSKSSIYSMNFNSNKLLKISSISQLFVVNSAAFLILT